MEEDYTIEGIKEQTEKLYSDLITKSNDLEKRIITANEYLNSVKNENRSYQKTWDSLKEIFKSAEESVKKFKLDKLIIGNLFKETQNFYQKKYLPARNAILDPDNGLSNSIKISKSRKKEIEKIGIFCKEQYSKIKENVKVHSNTLKTLIILESRVKKIFEEISLRGEKSKTIDNEISNTKKLTDKLKSDIEVSTKLAKELENEIRSLQKQALSSLELIDEYKSKSESTYKEILSIYEIAADTGRSGEFDRRRKALTYELQEWQKRLFRTTLSLLIFILIMFIVQLWLCKWNIKVAGNDVNFYLRFLLASPIVFYITFCTTQFNRTKKLIDQYTFKTTLAVSIKSHLEMLVNETRFSKDDHINNVLEFTINALKSIYKEPYNDDRMKLNLKLKAMELSMEKKSEANSKIESLSDRFDNFLLKSRTSNL